MRTKTRIFIGLKVLESFLFVLANFIIYWIGRFTQPRFFSEEKETILMFWGTGILTIIIMMLGLGLLFMIFIGPIKALIDKNWEWAEEIERKRRK